MLLSSLLAPAPCKSSHLAEDFYNEDLSMLLQKLFIEGSSRKSRQLEEENAGSSEPEEFVPDAGKIEMDPEEISRFNSYMDAIYQKMNAALITKLMDPMILNLSQTSKNPSTKKRHSRSLLENNPELLDLIDSEVEGRKFKSSPKHRGNKSSRKSVNSKNSNHNNNKKGKLKKTHGNDPKKKTQK